jgi:DTW domain-containing protein YfiP
VMHHREMGLTSNTARLAAGCLSHCEIRIRGDLSQPMSGEGMKVPERESLLLFPSEDAVELTPEFVAGLGRDAILVVPDGSWRQARKVPAREPAVAGMKRVKLPSGGGPSRYFLRREPNEWSVSTFEAIARALGVLEGPERGPQVQALLEQVFDLKIERSLWAKGLRAASECRFPIPQEAFDEYRRNGVIGGIMSGRPPRRMD